MITFGDVASRIPAVSAEVSGAEVYDRFEAEPDLVAIAVVDGAEVPIGLLERNAFALRMASTYGRALYAGRSVGKVMDAAPLVAERSRLVSDFATEALDGRPSDLLKGIIVVEQGRYFGVAAVTAILRALTDQARSQAAELQGLALDLGRAEHEAKSAGDLLKEAIEAMNEGVALFDPDDRYVLWNRRYADLHRLSQDHLGVGTDFAEVISAGARAGQYVEAVGREAAWTSERLLRRRTLTDRHAEEQELPDGRFVRLEETRLATGGVISVAVDVTDLRRREASFRFLFESNPVPLAVVDPASLAILAANDAALDQYGYVREDFLRLNAADILAPEHHLEAVEALRAGGSGAASRRIWTHRRRDGERLEIRSFERTLSYEGRPAVLVAALDVTAQRRAEASLTAALRQAESANLAKREFLANMSHEIRTPLNGVIGLASVLARSGLKPEQQELVGVIDSSARTLHALLNDLLEFSKLESGQLTLQPEPADLAAIAQRSAALFQPAAAEKGLSFRLELCGPVERPVLADRVRLAQVVNNLLSNAVKFTERGGVELRVACAPREGALAVRILVADTGIGISPEARTRLFERFSQADGSITRRFGGTGLGLAICQQLAGLMGGRIEVASRPGEGSTFSVDLELPLAPAGAQTGVPDAPAGLGAGGGNPDAPPRVLLVEDHPVNRRVVEVMIGELVALVSVENGAEALEALERERFDLVLMDMQMPVMDGLTATRRWRARERAEGSPRTPIVILTANALAEHVEQCREAGADLHLAKPVTLEGLLAAIEAALETGAEDPAAAAGRLAG